MYMKSYLYVYEVVVSVKLKTVVNISTCDPVELSVGCKLKESEASPFFISSLLHENTVALCPALPIPQCLPVGLAIIQGRTKQLAA